MHEWKTKKRLKKIIIEMHKKMPKGFEPHAFVIARDLIPPFFEYKGIKIVYHQLIPKGQILLLDIEQYKEIIKHGKT